MRILESRIRSRIIPILSHYPGYVATYNDKEKHPPNRISLISLTYHILALILHPYYILSLPYLYFFEIIIPEISEIYLLIHKIFKSIWVSWLSYHIKSIQVSYHRWYFSILVKYFFTLICLYHSMLTDYSWSSFVFLTQWK